MPYCSFTFPRLPQSSTAADIYQQPSSQTQVPQQHSPPDGAHPKMLAPDCQESSSLSCLSSCQPCRCHEIFKRNSVEDSNFKHKTCPTSFLPPPPTIKKHTKQNLLISKGTYFACASACIKINSHFRAKARCSLAKLS